MDTFSYDMNIVNLLEVNGDVTVIRCVRRVKAGTAKLRG